MRQGLLLVLLLAFRILNVLTIRTFFQPDEYWQSLEPGHILVYGYGYLTWEWKERIRSSAHVLLFAGVYKLADLIGIDVVLAPKLVQAVFAAIGDYYMYVLAKRILGGQDGQWALAASLGSAINWYCITRTFSNSLETVLTTVALAYWPWNSRMLNVRHYTLALVIASLSCVIRPTNVLLWMGLGSYLMWKSTRTLAVMGLPMVIGLASLIVNGVLDYWYYGELVFPLVKFIQFNVVQSLSQFYGVSPVHYYLSQGLPLLLMGYLPMTILEMWKSRQSIIVCVIAFVVAVYSCLQHKEVRFILPLMPLLHLLFAKSLTRFRPKSRLRIITVLILAVNLPVALYFSLYHQRGVVDVIDYLQKSNVNSVGFLMPCHSTPWQSHLHKDIPAWFLTCEPPIGMAEDERMEYLDVADQFYEDPLMFLNNNNFAESYIWPPSHIVFFEALEPTIIDYLAENSYRFDRRFFNSHFHDDWRRTGDVIVYSIA